MKESKFARSSAELVDLRRSLERMHDALGVNYTSFSDVMESLDDMRVDLKPTPQTFKMIKLFKSKSEDFSKAGNPVEFWTEQARKCENVLDAVRLYLEANYQQLVGVQVVKNRIMYLANKGAWK